MLWIGPGKSAKSPAFHGNRNIILAATYRLICCALHISRFCELYRSFERKLSPTMRQSHPAGDKVFVDYSGKTVPIVDPVTGEVKSAELFVGVLGASSYTYAEVTWSQTLPDWVGAHVRMFAHFGSVTRLVVYDYVPRNIIAVLCPPALCGAPSSSC